MKLESRSHEMSKETRVPRLLRLALLQEPMGFVDGADLYQFVESDPIDATDPSGLDSVSGTPISGSEGQFKSANGTTIMVAAYLDGKMETTVDGKLSTLKTSIIISATSSDKAKDTCDDIHFVQFKTRNEIRKPNTPPDNSFYHSSGLWHAPGKWYLDSIDNNTFYDAGLGSATVRNPGIVAIGDYPSKIDAMDDPQYFEGKDFIISGDVKWLIVWKMIWEPDKIPVVTVESSKAADGFGEFNTATWLKGYSNAADDFKSASDPVSVANPFFKK